MNKQYAKIIQYGSELPNIALFTPFEVDNEWDDDQQSQAEEFPQLDGEFDFDSGYSPKTKKTITVRFIINGSCLKNKYIQDIVFAGKQLQFKNETGYLRYIKDWLYRSIRGNMKNGGSKRIYAVMEDGTLRYTWAKPLSIPYAQNKDNADNSILSFVAEFEAVDPYWYEVKDGSVYLDYLKVDDILSACQDQSILRQEAEVIGIDKTYFDLADCQDNGIILSPSGFLAGDCDSQVCEFNQQYSIGIKANQSLIEGVLSDFQLKYDMRKLPSRFFELIQSDGSDIQVTQGNNVLKREIIDLDKINKTGFLFFTSNSLTNLTDNNIFYIRFGNQFIGAANDSTMWSDSNLVLHMNDDDSTGLLDSSPNGNDGIKVQGINEPIQAEGWTYKAQEYDGADDVVGIENSGGEVYNNTDFAVIAIFSRDQQNLVENMYVFSHPENTVDNRIYISNSFGTDNLAYTIGITSGALLSGTLINHKWNHVVLTFNRGTNRANAWVNGVKVANDAVIVAPGIVLEDIAIGSQNATGASVETWDGKIDHIRFMPSEVDSAWAVTNYNNMMQDSFWNLIDADGIIVEQLLENNSLEIFTGTPDDGITDNWDNWSSLNASTDGNYIDANTLYVTDGTYGVHFHRGNSVEPELVGSVTLQSNTDYFIYYYGQSDGIGITGLQIVSSETTPRFLQDDGTWDVATNTEIAITEIATTNTEIVLRKMRFTTPDFSGGYIIKGRHVTAATSDTHIDYISMIEDTNIVNETCPCTVDPLLDVEQSVCINTQKTNLIQNDNFEQWQGIANDDITDNFAYWNTDLGGISYIDKKITGTKSFRDAANASNISQNTISLESGKSYIITFIASVVSAGLGRILLQDLTTSNWLQDDASWAAPKVRITPLEIGSTIEVTTTFSFVAESTGLYDITIENAGSPSGILLTNSIYINEITETGSVSICVEGSDGATRPKISYFGELVNPLITNELNRYTLQYNGAIASDEYLTIDFNSSNTGDLIDFEIQTNIPNFDINNFVVDGNEGFFELDMGVNNLTVTGGTENESKVCIHILNKYHN